MMRRTLIIGAAAAATIAASCGEAIDQNAFSGPPVEVVSLDDNHTALKEAFNAASSNVRLVFVVGPSCGPCLRGLIDMDKEMGSKLLSDPRLSVFVVHVPTLSAELKHAQRAARLLTGSSVQNFWDESGNTGWALKDTLGLEEYAWDVWLTYSQGQQWTDAGPPKPDAWSHQLGDISIAPFLDPKAFASDVRTRVEKIG